LKIEDSLNRICAEDIYAKDPLPPFRASIKDGFALKLSESYRKGETITLTVVGNSNAGDSINICLKENECVKINTGAYVPLSADAVIQIEDTISISKNENGEDTQIQVPDSTIEIEQDIRPIGNL
jgi:molybdopterin biosynthesis enzyme